MAVVMMRMREGSAVERIVNPLMNGVRHVEIED